MPSQGVRAKFDAVLAIRQAHGFTFGKSDLFFCVALVCVRRIDRSSQWMDGTWSSAWRSCAFVR
jgi:hypothetical protein